MAFTGICGPVDDAPAYEADRERALGETQRMLRDDPEAWHALFDFVAAAWLADMKQANGTVLRYNPSGREYERMELRLMAAQDAFDRLGVSGEERAGTAEELLERARAFIGSQRLAERAPGLATSSRAVVGHLPVRAVEQDETSFAAVS
jgi:hypothetical protein